MILSPNHILAGGSGKLQGLVIKRYGDKTVLSVKPDMSHRKLSQKQKQANERMSDAIRRAKGICGHLPSKQRACDILGVPSNKVFRALVKQWLLTDGTHEVFEGTPQEVASQETLVQLKKETQTQLPGSEVFLFGERAKGFQNPQADWDMLVLTTTATIREQKWELQDRLQALTLKDGTRVNLLLVQKEQWESGVEYQILRKRIEAELTAVR